MTLEAVHPDSGEAVTALAELALGIDGDGATLRISLRMAVDAADQTVLRAPYSAMHRFVPLMQEKPHMIAAHDIRGLHAFLALRRRRYQRSQGGALLRSPDRARQDERQQHGDIARPVRHSPMPISMYPLGQTSEQM